MEIHTPKAFRGWRGFLKEYGTIVIGVLTALVAEQAVEAYHHREQVRHGDEALKSNYFVVLRSVAGTARLDAVSAGAASSISRLPKLHSSKCSSDCHVRI